MGDLHPLASSEAASPPHENRWLPGCQRLGTYVPLYQSPLSGSSNRRVAEGQVGHPVAIAMSCRATRLCCIFCQVRKGITPECCNGVWSIPQREYLAELAELEAFGVSSSPDRLRVCFMGCCHSSDGFLNARCAVSRALTAPALSRIGLPHYLMVLPPQVLTDRASYIVP